MLACLSRPYGTDIVAVALTLRWPSSSINQAFARGELVERCQDLSLAAVRWRRIKALLIECRRARRWAQGHRKMVLVDEPSMHMLSTPFQVLMHLAVFAQ